MTQLPSVSIALCTHNGARFLKEQLESIAAQSYLPSELIVTDDESSDTTIDILKAFAEEVGFRVVIHQNNPKLKTVKNFEKAVGLCSGDYVFLCDQDDYWYSDKIKKMLAFMAEHPKAVVGFSNALIVNDKRESMNQFQLDMVRLRAPQRQQWRAGQAFDLLLEGNRLTGCTAVMTRAFAQKTIPFPEHIPTLIHDGWIALIAATNPNGIVFTEEVLMEYRQHDAQQIGSNFEDNGPATTLKTRFERTRAEKVLPIINKRQFYVAILNEIARISSTKNPELLKIERKIAHLNARINLPSKKYKRVLPVIKEFLRGNYKKYIDQDARFYGHLLTAAGDIFE